MSDKDRIEQLLIAGKTGEAITDFLKTAKVAGAELLYDKIVLLSSAWQMNLADKSEISREEYRSEYSRINRELNAALDELSADSGPEDPHKREMAGLQSALDTKIALLGELRREEAISSDTVKKFELRQRIPVLEDEIVALKDKIRQERDEDESTHTIHFHTPAGDFVKSVSSTAGGDMVQHIDVAQFLDFEPEEAPKRGILFLAATPTDQIPLQIGEEFRSIKDRLRSASQGRDFEFMVPELALTIENLIMALKSAPEIVHFSGHGVQDGICIADDENRTLKVPTSTLKRLFKRLKGKTKLVVLNSCWSSSQAEVLSSLGIYVTGMSRPVNDEAAIDFAEGIYLGLGEGKPVEEAFEDGLIILETKHPKQAQIPALWKDGKVLDI